MKLLALVMPSAYREAIIRVAQEENVVLADPMPVVVSLVEAIARGETPPGLEGVRSLPGYNPKQPRTALFADPIHLNSGGHYVIAAQLFEAIMESGLLEKMLARS